MAEAKVLNTTSEDVKKSVASIYSELLNKRRSEKENKIERRRLEKESKRQAIEEESKTEDGQEEKPLSKKERRQAELESWRETIIGLTGDDLDYVPSKKNKKKYKKWIDDETGENVVLATKPAKKKKKNFHKEFEPELNMLKAIVSDQNRFTTDLQKRYQNAAGPVTKDAMPLNKTQVELASVIIASRSNSLGILREIGNLKKTVADLYMKQYKIDNDGNGEGFGTQDLGMMGSSLAQGMFGNAMATASVGSINEGPVGLADKPVTPTTTQTSAQGDVVFKKFDPDSWDGGGLNSGNTKFEAIPHKVIVELHKDDDKARFKAVRTDTGEELVGAPVPTCTITAIDVNTKVAKDSFDQVYQVEIIE